MMPHDGRDVGQNLCSINRFFIEVYRGRLKLALCGQCSSVVMMEITASLHVV